MNVVGLIVEYNPLHNGHVYHFEQSKKKTQADAVVIIMSGNFLQRGEPALVNKWARAEMALQMGADLIFELPYAYSTQQAKLFAFGAVFLLDQLPFVTHLCFGSERGEINSLKQIAQFLVEEPPQFQQMIKREMSTGQSYPNAYSKTIQDYLGLQTADESLLQQPNNILGLHYLISLYQLRSSIIPTTIQREKAGYHQQNFTDQHIASATSIRKALFASAEPEWEKIRSFVPEYTYQILQREAAEGRGPLSWEHYFALLRHQLLSTPVETLSQLYEMEEGIEYRLQQKIRDAASFEQLCQLVKSKRYTWNRIQRILLHTYTHFTKQEASGYLAQGPAYLRLLGFSETGQALLHQYKKKMGLPLISSIKKEHPSMLDRDIKAAYLHALGYPALKERELGADEVRQVPLYFPGRSCK